MTEWGVVLVIIALVGLLATIGAPIIKLNSTIVKLLTIVDSLKGDVTELTDKNTQSHGRLWKHNEKQDAKIDDHEKRITVIERTKDS